MYGLILYFEEIVINKSLANVRSDFLKLFGKYERKIKLFDGNIDGNELIMELHGTERKAPRWIIFEPKLFGYLSEENNSKTKISIKIILGIWSIIFFTIISFVFFLLFLQFIILFFNEKDIFGLIISFLLISLPIGILIHIVFTKKK